MFSTIFFVLATLFLSLNFIRPFGFAISDWLFMGSLFMAICETLISKKSFVSIWSSIRIFIWPAMLITLGAVISISNSMNISVAIIELMQQLYVITVFLSITYIMVLRGRTELIISVFIISGVFSAGIASVDYLLGTNYGPLLSGAPQTQFWGRFAGTLGHPNKFGYFLVLTSILTIYKLLNIRGRRKSFGFACIILIALLVQIFGVYLSGSVTAYLGLLMGLSCLLFIAVPKRCRKAFYFTGFLLVVAILIVSIISINGISSPQIGSQDSSLINRGIDRVLNITAGERIDLYNSAIDFIERSPIIGAGYDQISTSGVSLDSRFLSGSIHNLFLQIWYVGGVFAFLGWLIVHVYVGKISLVNLYQQSKNRINLLSVLSAAVLAILIMDQFQDVIYEREKWLVISLLVSVMWINKSLTNNYRSNFLNYTHQVHFQANKYWRKK